ncbi:hypothetical protein D3C80_973350 [compost metagenome]
MADHLIKHKIIKLSTPIGPQLGSFIITKVRSLSPKPPTQASAVSASPSKCKPPVSQIQTTKIKLLSKIIGSACNNETMANKIAPIIKPISG